MESRLGRGWVTSAAGAALVLVMLSGLAACGPHRRQAGREGRHRRCQPVQRDLQRRLDDQHRQPDLPGRRAGRSAVLRLPHLRLEPVHLPDPDAGRPKQRRPGHAALPAPGALVQHAAADRLGPAGSLARGQHRAAHRADRQPAGGGPGPAARRERRGGAVRHPLQRHLLQQRRLHPEAVHRAPVRRRLRAGRLGQLRQPALPAGGRQRPVPQSRLGGLAGGEDRLARLQRRRRRLPRHLLLQRPVRPGGHAYRAEDAHPWGMDLGLVRACGQRPRLLHRRRQPHPRHPAIRPALVLLQPRHGAGQRVRDPRPARSPAPRRSATPIRRPARAPSPTNRSTSAAPTRSSPGAPAPPTAPWSRTARRSRTPTAAATSPASTPRYSRNSPASGATTR